MGDVLEIGSLEDRESDGKLSLCRLIGEKSVVRISVGLNWLKFMTFVTEELGLRVQRPGSLL